MCPFSFDVGYFYSVFLLFFLIILTRVFLNLFKLTAFSFTDPLCFRFIFCFINICSYLYDSFFITFFGVYLTPKLMPVQ